MMLPSMYIHASHLYIDFVIDLTHSIGIINHYYDGHRLSKAYQLQALKSLPTIFPVIKMLFNRPMGD